MEDGRQGQREGKKESERARERPCLESCHGVKQNKRNTPLSRLDQGECVSYLARANRDLNG